MEPTTKDAAASAPMAPPASSSEASGARPADQASRQNNLQRIQQRKQQMYSWPQARKLLKLANYSACQTEECKCNGWKNPMTQKPKPENQQPASFRTSCKTCDHSLENHVRHLPTQNEDELNRLLGMAIDLDNIYMGMSREEDADTKNVYYYLFR